MMTTSSKQLLIGLGLCTATSLVQAKQVVCVFDLVGKSGDVYALMKDYQLAAKNWGADIELRVAQNEAVIAEDFKAGKCDGISVRACGDANLMILQVRWMRLGRFPISNWQSKSCKV